MGSHGTGTRAPGRGDREVVARQVGREPRGSWSVACCCEHGYPQVIVTPPALEDGSPFPTLFWLTCPFLVESVSRLESAGAAAEWAGVLARDPERAERMLEADRRYRLLRAAQAAPAPDPCATVGIAGQVDPLATKCVHAHVAAFLGGFDDPVGEAVLDEVPRTCGDARCALPDERAAQVREGE